jgi:hypothetical protein
MMPDAQPMPMNSVSFRPAIPRRVAPQQSPLPLRRPRQCTTGLHPGTIDAGQPVLIFLSHRWGAVHCRSSEICFVAMRESKSDCACARSGMAERVHYGIAILTKWHPHGNLRCEVFSEASGMGPQSGRGKPGIYRTRVSISHEQRGKRGATVDYLLFFSFEPLRRPRICAEDKMSLADN